MPIIYDLARSLIPKRLKRIFSQTLAPFFYGKKFLIGAKQRSEIRFWERYFADKGTEPETEYYCKFMMDMGGIEKKSFFDNLICLDIGCGPKGSLTWLTNARAAIGLDPLADQYMKFGIADHNMIYISAPAEKIPLPTNYVDVVFSMNSLDHVDDVTAVCSEIRRVLKPGGYFIGSLNLDEPPTLGEPFTLTEEFLEKHLFYGWQKQFYKTRPKVDEAGEVTYRFFYEDCPQELLEASVPRALWCRFRAK